MEKKYLRKVRSYHSVDWFKEQYSAQDVLIKSINYPKYVYEGDYLSSVYSDRFREEWHAAEKAAGLTGFTDEWRYASDEEILKFAKLLFDNQEIDGCRILRHTNVSNGYPLWSVEVFKSNNKLEYDFRENVKYNIYDYDGVLIECL